MVSPCKKKRFEKKIRSPGSYQTSTSPNARKRLKPLENKKFYLDIRNTAVIRKIQDKLSSLGGAIEAFLERDVDYVVTDRGRESASPQSVSPANSGLHSPADGAPTANRTRSRGEAMLEKVKQHSTGLKSSPAADILDRASSWNIPVYPIHRFLSWLERLSSRVEKVVERSSTGLRHLRGHFLKLETEDGLRPEFRVFSSWPTLDLKSSGAAFTDHETNSQRMTRKSGSKLLVGGGKGDGTTSVGAAAGGGGYCEVCRVNYTWLEGHLSSVGHIKAVTDPSQYQELDSLISAHSLGSLRKSLRIAKSPTPALPPPAPPTTSPSSSSSSSPNITPLHHHRLRSSPPLCNGHLTPPSNNSHSASSSNQVMCNGVGARKLEVKIRDEGCSQSHNLRSRLASPPRTPRGRVSKKRLSAEEKLIEDNKAYYKVEVLNSKLRSTGCLQKQQALKEEEVGDTGTSGGSDNGKDQEEEPVVVRFKKVRKSQLALLSDEAESFMFGKKDEEPSPSEPEESNKKKRRTHAEAFINDNHDYYKFECPNSRLRYQGTTLAHVPVKEEQVSSPEEEDVKPTEVTFAFEMEGMREEAWCEVVRRQDSFKEEWLPRYHKYPHFVLPSEMPYQERLKLLSRRRRRMSRCLDDRPRKSPRCHASTLAMMSSILPHSADEDTTNTSTSFMTQESSSSDTNLSEPRLLHNRIFQHICSLYDPINDKYWTELTKHKDKTPKKFDVDLRHDVCLPVDPTIIDGNSTCLLPAANTPTNFSMIMETYKDCSSLEKCLLEASHFLRPFDAAYFDNSCASSDCSELFGFSDDGRCVPGRRRKRKRNLTGWPQEKPKKRSMKGLKSEPIGNIMNTCEDAQLGGSVSGNLPYNNDLMLNFVNSISKNNPTIPVKKKRGRPRIYPPGMSPSSLKKKAAALRSASVAYTPPSAHFSSSDLFSSSHSFSSPYHQKKPSLRHHY